MINPSLRRCIGIAVLAAGSLTFLTASAGDPFHGLRTQDVPDCVGNWCCDDYCPKGMPCVRVPLCFGCDDYCSKPQPCVHAPLCYSCDDYCKKCLPIVCNHPRCRCRRCGPASCDVASCDEGCGDEGSCEVTLSESTSSGKKTCEEASCETPTLVAMDADDGALETMSRGSEAPEFGTTSKESTNSRSDRPRPVRLPPVVAASKPPSSSPPADLR